MASTDRGATTPVYEPQPRYGHALVEYEGCAYLVGGLDSGGSPIELSSVEVFDLTTFKWQCRTTTGVCPDEVYQAACAILGHYLYICGGKVRGEATDALWRLDLKSLRWSPVQQTNMPSPRRHARLVADNKQRLILLDSTNKVDRSLHDLHVFSIEYGEWSSPVTTGTRPYTLSSFSFTLVGSQAVLFDGDGLYCFDVDNKHWSKVYTDGPRPDRRWWHAAVSLSSQTLLVSGGWDGGGVCDDFWIVDLSTRRWKKVELHCGVRRFGHAAAAVKSGSTVHIVEFGGKDPHDSAMAATTFLQMTLDCEGEGRAGNWRLVDYYTSMAAAAAAAECTRIYEEALSKGYINTRNSVIVVTGANGSGKTHVREAISNRPPPPVRESTALSEDPITYSILNASAGNWRVMDMEQQTRMLTSAMAAWTALKRNEEVNPHPSILPDSTSPLLTEDTSQTATSSSTAMQLPPHSATPTLEPVGPVPLTPPSQHRPSPPQPRHEKAYNEMPHPVKTDFLHRIRQALYTEEEPYNFDLVYLFDTGGQPAFHAILPLFFPMIMFIIFVLKLSEKLGHHPVVNYFVRGKLIGAPYTSPLSHLEIAQHSFSTVQSQMLAQQHSGRGLPKMMVVGTHRDKEWHCSESIHEKNRKLSEILSPSFQEHLIYHSAERKSLVFPLDAKHRKQEDCQVTAEIRQAITMATSAIESKRTPLSWHILELALRQSAGKLGRGFLTRTECIAEATKLSISHQVLDAALDHFVHLNTILYYRTVLPNLVFILAQPLMQKMTELIQKTHALRGQVPNTRTPIDGKWFKFRDQGIVTLDILESFPDGYLEGIFTAADLVRLMEHKLLVSPIDHSSYFMPVLLPDLSPNEVAQHRVGCESAIAPLTVLFSCNVVPSGLFCSLVSSLLSNATPPQLCLCAKPSDRTSVECVAANCIKFSLPDNAGSVVLVNTYVHLELHVSTPLIEFPTTLCLALKSKVLTSVATASHALHFDQLEQECGFLCESSTPHAKVTMTPDRFWLGRLIFGDPRQVEVAPPTHPAVLSKEHGWVCSLDGHICGRFQKRHTVWLQTCGEHSLVVVTGGGGAAGGEDASSGGGAAAGHTMDSICDKFPECKTAPPLGPDDLGQVLRVLHDVGLAAKWLTIGQTLTVSDANLADFEARFSGDSSLCLLQVVATWLRGQKRHPDPPSRCRLAWAVTDPLGGGTVIEGERIAAIFKAQYEQFKFVPTSALAKETPPTPLLDDFLGGPHIYDNVDVATEALSRELSDVAHRWIQVGVLLDVGLPWLEQRRSTRQTDQQNLRETLHHWLDSLFEDITLQRLVEAVEHSAGGDNPALASAIKSKLTG